MTVAPGPLLGLLAPMVGQSAPTEPVATRISPGQVDQFITSGLGAMLHHEVRAGRVATDQPSADLLTGCDLAARVIYRRTCRSLEHCLKLLNNIGVQPVLLKGAWMCEHYYAQPHWRTLGDVDLLVPPAHLEECYALLVAEGFRNGSDKTEAAWDDHHHMAPLHHPELGIWIELHRQLFRNASMFAPIPEFATNAVIAAARPDKLYGADVLGIPAPVNLRYLSSHWYWSLMEGIKANQARGMLDVALQLRESGGAAQLAIEPDAAGFATVVMLRALASGGLLAYYQDTDQSARALRGPNAALSVSLAEKIVARGVTSLKKSENLFLDQVRGDWLGVLIEARGLWQVGLKTVGVTWRRIYGLVLHKLGGTPSP